MKKRILATLLAALMMVSLLPTTVFAEVNEGDVAQIGETGYATLKAAVDEVQTGETVTLLKDYTLASDEHLITGENQDLVLDLGGHTLTTGQGPQLRMRSNWTVKNGTINGSATSRHGVIEANAQVSNTVTLTLEDVTITGNKAAFVVCANANNVTTNVTLTVPAGKTATLNGGTNNNNNAAIIVTANCDNRDWSSFVGTLTINGEGKLYVNGPEAAINVSDSASKVTLENPNAYYQSTVNEQGIDLLYDMGIWNIFTVKGGYFSRDFGAGQNYGGLTIPSPYKKVSNTDPATSSQYPIKVAAPEVTYVAQNVDTGKNYTSLQSAVNAANSGDTVVLLKDVGKGSSTSAAQYEAFAQNNTLTIDLNGHKIDGYYSFGAIIVDKANVTIKDSTSSGNASIKNNYTTTPANAVFMQNEDNILTLENVKLESYGNGIQLQTSTTGSTVNVNAGAEVHSTYYRGINAAAKATINVNGGTVKADDYQGIYTSGAESTVNVENGTVEGDGYQGIFVAGANSTVTVSGGTVTGKIGIVGYAEKCEINVTGGTVSSNNDNSAIQNQGANSTITVDGGTVTSTKYGIVTLAAATVNVKGGNVNGDKIGILPQTNDSTVNITGGSVTSNDTAIQIFGSGNTANITGGTVSATGEGSTGIYSGSDTESARNKITVNGGTVTAGDYGIALFAYGTLDVKSGSVTATSGHAIVNNGSDTKDSIVNISGGTITAGPNGEGYYHAGPGTLNITGGTISGMTGVEMRAGTINVSGGELISTATEYECDANANGPTTNGAALAIAQHTTKKDITVNITGGTFKGIVPVNECNPQENDPAPQVTMTVSDGEFWSTATENAKVFSCVDCDKFLTGGFFTHVPEAKYIAPGKVVRDTTNEEKTAHGEQYLYTIGVPPAVVVEPVATATDITVNDKPTGAVLTTEEQQIVEQVIEDIKANTAATAEGSTNIEKVFAGEETEAPKMEKSAENFIVLKKDDEGKTFTQEVTISVVEADTLQTVAEKAAKEVFGAETTLADEDISKRINIHLDAVTTETTTQAQTTTTENGMIYDVKPIATVTKSTGESFEMIIPNELIKGHPIDFRLPLDSRFDGVTYISVKHNGTYIGTYQAQGENGQRYVALSADEFSEYELTATDKLQKEYYLIEKPVANGANGTYNQRSYYLEQDGTKHVVNAKLLGEADREVSFAQWYLRTSVQYWTKYVNDDECDVRFVSMLGDDLKQYQEAGFHVKIGDESLDLKTKVAYQSYEADGKEISISEYSDPKDYFFLMNNAFGSKYADTDITVQAYVRLADDTVLEGREVSFKISQFTDIS